MAAKFQNANGSTPNMGTPVTAPTPSYGMNGTLPPAPQLDITGPLPTQGQSGLDGAMSLLADKLHPVRR